MHRVSWICQSRGNGKCLRSGRRNMVRKTQEMAHPLTLLRVYAGSIFSVSILGRPYIVFSSVEVMEELERKGSNFSDRPVLPMAGVLLGFDQMVLLAPYGPRWRMFRKYFTRAFGPGKPIQTMYPLIIDESRKFIQRVLENPDPTDLLSHCHKYASLYLRPLILNHFIYLLDLQKVPSCARHTAIECRRKTTRMSSLWRKREETSALQ